MSVTAHFRGGPLDGAMYQLPDANPTYNIPSVPLVITAGQEPVATPKSFVYWRAPGVVGSEAVYEFQGTLRGREDERV